MKSGRHTPGVLEPLDGVGHDADTAEEPGALLLVHLLLVPHGHRDHVLRTHVPVTHPRAKTFVCSRKTLSYILLNLISDRYIFDFYTFRLI